MVLPAGPNMPGTPAADREGLTMPTALRLLLLPLAALALPWALPGQAGDPPRDTKPAPVRLRRPVALVLADGGKKLLVANRDSGTVAVVDTQALRVVGETHVGGKLSDLTATRDGGLLLATDEDA